MISHATWGKILKYGAFLLLIAQNSSIVLVSRWMKLTQIVKGKDDDLILITFGEFMKLVSCVVILVIGGMRDWQAGWRNWVEVCNLKEFCKVSYLCKY